MKISSSSRFYTIKRKASMLLIAFMLGMSNVILQETRMVNDTRVKTEQLDIASDEVDD